MPGKLATLIQAISASVATANRECITVMDIIDRIRKAQGGVGGLAGRPRCRMQGCAPGAGGPAGERNGNFRHGFYTKETRARLRAMRDLAREVRDLTRKLGGSLRSGTREAGGPR